jgi:hypothetical protein
LVTKPRAPLFDLFTVEQLASLTPYSAAYLRDLEGRPERIRPRFRQVVSRLLGKSEDELFESPSGQTPISEALS